MKRATALALLAFVVSCGGGDDTVIPPPPSPTPTPCTQTSVFGPVAGQVPANTLDTESFTTNASGRVDVFLDWTFSDSPIGVYVVQGGCNLDQFNARSCNFLIRSEPPGTKPRRVSASNVAPGTYGLLIANFADVQESLSTQVFLSSASCPPLAVSAPSGAALGHARGQVSGIMRHP
jgi:hypothetical protein